MATSVIQALNTSYRGRYTLPTNTDLDTVTEHGFYGLSSSNDYPNMPPKRCYELFVGRVGTGTLGMQIAFSGARVYTRLRTSSGWTSWLDIQGDWGARVGNNTIPDNTDFDNLTTPGSYIVANATHMATMSNTPFTTTGCRLDVIGVADDTSHLRQFCFAIGGESVYVRARTGSSWTAWMNLITPYSYRPKGSFTSNIGGFGWVNGTGLYICVPQVVPRGSTVSAVTSAKINMRKPTGGYLVSSGFDIAQYISTITASAQGFYISATKSDGWGDVPNNIPITGTVELSVTLE